MTPGGASGYPTTLESLSHVADSLHTRRGRCETGEKETLRISTDYAGFFSYVVRGGRSLEGRANVRASGERAARRREGEARVAAVDHEEVEGRARACERAASEIKGRARRFSFVRAKNRLL